MIFKVFFPEDGETIEDAIEFSTYNEYNAAILATEYDYGDRDGWERLKYGTCAPFLVIVVDEDGNEYKYKAIHEPTVEHHVYNA